MSTTTDSQKLALDAAVHKILLTVFTINQLIPIIRPHKKTKLFLVPSLLTFGCRIFFYKNADNALEIELKHSKIEMPLSFLKNFYT